ncbi:MAG: multiheme c-type cytochrome [Planctomycetota bacterium]
MDFSGSYRFGSYDFDLHIRQRGARVAFSCGGVDRQDIGGAFQAVGEGRVEDGRIRARWWCLDISRNFANTGGCEMWFEDRSHDLLRVRYYHDADEKIEEGYGLRLGRGRRRVPYRVRIPQPVKELARPITLEGTVHGRGGEAVEDAAVMLRHDEASVVRTDAAGRFRLRVGRQPAVLMVAAAAPGYRNAVEALLLHEVRPLRFVLNPAGGGDDPRYRFIDPTPDRERDLWRCGNCHRNSYEEWKESRHARTARDPVVRALYRGDFLPALAAGRAKGGEGLCSACHAPAAALDDPQARLDRVAGTDLHGNHCDFCHKVHHVEEPDAPGVRGSLVVRRPSVDDPVPGPIKRTYGALADSDYLFMGSAYSPFHATSLLCSGCHQYRTADGVPALDTHHEWREWAAGRSRIETCQSCHMASGVSRERGRTARRICINALRRPAEQIHTHAFEGRPLAPDALAIELRAAAAGGRLVVRASVSTREVGHRVPTGSGDKHLLLLVLATDARGRPLRLLDGTRLPDHAGGRGDPLAADAAEVVRRLEAGDLARFPGREFAQVLADAEGRTHVPFWRAVRVVRDTRLRPDSTVQTRHVFAATGPRPIRVRAELVHRLLFKSRAVQARIRWPEERPLDRIVAAQVTTVE